MGWRKAWLTNKLPINSASVFTPCEIISAAFMKSCTSRHAPKRWRNSGGNESYRQTRADTAGLVRGHFMPHDMRRFGATLGVYDGAHCLSGEIVGRVRF